MTSEYLQKSLLLDFVPFMPAQHEQDAMLTQDAALTLRTHAVVTETDQAVEKYIIEQVKSRYPDHKFIGEESYAGGEVVDLTDEPTWIVDPIGEFALHLQT